MKKTTVTETDRRKDGRTYGLGDGYGDDDDGGSGGGECDEDHDGRVFGAWCLMSASLFICAMMSESKCSFPIFKCSCIPPNGQMYNAVVVVVVHTTHKTKYTNNMKSTWPHIANNGVVIHTRNCQRAPHILFP